MKTIAPAPRQLMAALNPVPSDQKFSEDVSCSTKHGKDEKVRADEDMNTYSAQLNQVVSYLDMQRSYTSKRK